jgi:hypothetical protein
VTNAPGPALAIGLRWGGATIASVRDLDIESIGGGAIAVGAVGLEAGGSAGFDLARALIQGTVDQSVSLQGSATATISDLDVSGTKSILAHGEDSGSGVAVLDLSRLRMARFLVHDNARDGIVVDETVPGGGGVIRFSDGEVRGNAVGVRVLQPTFHVRDLLDRVEVDQNQQNLDAP